MGSKLNNKRGKESEQKGPQMDAKNGKSPFSEG